MTNSLEGAWGIQKQRLVAATAKPVAQPATLPPILLTSDEAAKLMRISLRSFNTIRSEPWMCRPVVLGPQTIRWNREELIEALTRRAPRGEPTEIQQARAQRKAAA